LHGRADLDLPKDWGHDVIEKDGKKYFALPPLNALLLVPAVAIYGVAFPERLFTLTLLALYLLFLLRILSKNWQFPTKWDLPLWLAFLGLGTDLLSVTARGTAWFSAAISSSFFLTCSAYFLWKGTTWSRYFYSVLLLCVASLGRYHLTLLIPVYLAVIYFKSNNNFKRTAAAAVPLLGYICAIAFWNWWRWDSPLSLNYQKHGYATHFHGLVSQYGFTNPLYILDHLHHGLFAVPELSSVYPFLNFDPNGNGLFATAPLFLVLFFYRKKYQTQDWVALACIGIVASVVMTHFSTGWSQFGYRYVLDVFPFLLFLTLRTDFKISSPLGISLVGISIFFRVIGTILSTL